MDNFFESDVHEDNLIAVCFELLEVDAKTVHLQVRLELSIAHCNNVNSSLSFTLDFCRRDEYDSIAYIGHDLVNTVIKTKTPRNAKLAVFILRKATDVTDPVTLEIV